MSSGDPEVARLLRHHLKQVPPHRALLRSVECRLMGRVDLHPPVLDVGCGDGRFAALAYDRPIDVGTDLPRTRLPSAELGEARTGGAYRSILAASATALPFADRRFRTVVSNSVLEHIADLDGALQEIARVLTPRGTFAFTTPSQHFGDFLAGNALLRWLGQPRLGQAYARWFDRISLHHHRLNPQAWHDKLARFGFEVRHFQYYFSETTHRVFDISHYVGAPTLLFRKISGHWVPGGWLTRPLEQWLCRHASADAQPAGAYLFFVCEKRNGGATHRRDA